MAYAWREQRATKEQIATLAKIFTEKPLPQTSVRPGCLKGYGNSGGLSKYF